MRPVMWFTRTVMALQVREFGHLVSKLIGYTIDRNWEAWSSIPPGTSHNAWIDALQPESFPLTWCVSECREKQVGNLRRPIRDFLALAVWGLTVHKESFIHYCGFLSVAFVPASCHLPRMFTLNVGIPWPTLCLFVWRVEWSAGYYLRKKLKDGSGGRGRVFYKLGPEVRELYERSD